MPRFIPRRSSQWRHRHTSDRGVLGYSWESALDDTLITLGAVIFARFAKQYCAEPEIPNSRRSRLSRAPQTGFPITALRNRARLCRPVSVCFTLILTAQQAPVPEKQASTSPKNKRPPYCTAATMGEEIRSVVLTTSNWPLNLTKAPEIARRVPSGTTISIFIGPVAALEVGVGILTSSSKIAQTVRIGSAPSDHLVLKSGLRSCQDVAWALI